MTNTDECLKAYKFENIERYFFPSLIFYLFILFIDNRRSLSSLSSQFVISLCCIVPYILVYFLYKKEKLRMADLDYVGIFIFSSLTLGVSLLAVLTTGIASGLYIRVMVISFFQFIVIPLNLRLTLVMELLLFLIYFPINIYLFPTYDGELFIQLSNYLFFPILKIIFSNRYYRQIEKRILINDLKEKLKQKENAQQVLGELLHLINNPLFISKSLIKKHIKTVDFHQTKNLDKALLANERMEAILQEVATLQKSTDFDFTNQKSVKDFFLKLKVEQKKMTIFF